MDEDQRRQIDGPSEPRLRRTPVPGTGPFSRKLGCILAFLGLFVLLMLIYLIYFWGMPFPLAL